MLAMEQLGIGEWIPSNIDTPLHSLNLPCYAARALGGLQQKTTTVLDALPSHLADRFTTPLGHSVLGLTCGLPILMITSSRILLDHYV